MTALLRRALVASLVALPLVAVGVAGAGWLTRAPEDLDLAHDKPSAAGLYRVGVAPEGAEPTVGPMHAWIVTVRSAEGAPVDDARLAIDGGMPRHGHGLPTAPAVTATLGEGRYRVEGVRFTMPGWWTLEIAVDGPSGADEAVLNLML